jgi:CheY-like chemotaxis protein/HPt (histidine-containing phosphotransfer) domain-containing protein
VVDDHPVNRLVAIAQVAALGYAADAVDSGEMALAALAAEPYDAVLLDCEMPHLDGYETCRRLRRREGGGRRTRVIALTAHTAPGERERCLAAGMDDHLGKPLQGEELAAVLSRWLEAVELPAPPTAEPDSLEERLAALQRLGEKTGEDVLGQVVESFLHQGARGLETIRRALTRGDGPALATAAHSLAGNSGILGAIGLAMGCAELEELARQQDLTACESRIAAVEQAYQSIARILAARLPGSRPTTIV